MRKADTVAFERAAKAYGLALKRGVYGELLTARSRFAWWFFFAGWRARMVFDKNRRSAKQATAVEAAGVKP